MSFEGNKARLIQELVDAQAQLRADYGMAPRKDPLTDPQPTSDSKQDKPAEPQAKPA